MPQKKFILPLLFIVTALPSLGHLRAQATADPAPVLAQLIDIGAQASTPDVTVKRSVCKALYWLRVSARQGYVPEQVIDRASALNGLNSSRAALVKHQLLLAYRRATEFGLFANRDTLELLRNGTLPRIRTGLHAGDVADVDYIVPVSSAPKWRNDLANIELVPAAVKMRRLRRVGARELDHAAQLAAAEADPTTYVVRIETPRYQGSRITAQFGQYVDLRQWGGYRYALCVLAEEADRIPVYLSGPAESKYVPSSIPTFISKDYATRLPGIPAPAHLIYDDRQGLRVFLTEDFPRRMGECSLVVQRQL